MNQSNFISEIITNEKVFIGQIIGKQDNLIKEIKAFWKGRQFGIFSAGYIASHVGGNGNYRTAVIITLPVSEHPEEGTLRLEDESGNFFEKYLTIRQVAHINGINSIEMMQLQKKPISKLQYASMEKGFLKISGFSQMAFSNDEMFLSHDRALMKATSNSGVNINLDTFLPSVGHEDVFWYLPNAAYCGVIASIDLGESVCNKSEIEINLNLGEFDTNTLSNTTWVPLDLRRYMNYPNLERLQRVQAYENSVSVTINGYSDARRIRKIFAMHGLNLSRKNILDWGCGHGRVLRHFMMDGDLNRVAGVDIDSDNVGWAKNALCSHDIHVGSLMPPTVFEDSSFDGVYGISVMTHLDPDIQSAWLAEIRRILRPGGLAVLTFAGSGSVAFGSRFFSREWLNEWNEQGVNATAYESFDTIVGKKDYYRNVFMTNDFMTRLWSHQMQVEAIYENMFGYQHVAILRK